MDIRLAIREDIESLVDFNQAMAVETEGIYLTNETLALGVEAVFDDPKKGFYVVAEETGRIAGGLMVTFEWSDWRNAWFWWIQSVYIVPEWRGKKVFSSMYRYVKENARDAGNVCGFRLYVEGNNTQARAVYEAVGMESSHYLMYEENT